MQDIAAWASPPSPPPPPSSVPSPQPTRPWLVSSFTKTYGRSGLRGQRNAKHFQVRDLQSRAETVKRVRFFVTRLKRKNGSHAQLSVVRDPAAAIAGTAANAAAPPIKASAIHEICFPWSALSSTSTPRPGPFGKAKNPPCGVAAPGPELGN